MLNGHDGDTTVSHGNEYLRELARAGKWLTLGRETREYGLKHNQPWKQVLWGWYWQYGIRKHLWENPMVKVLKGTYRTFSPRQSIPEVEEALWSIPLNPQFVEQINLTQRLRSVSNNAFTNERERHYDILSNDVMQNILEFLDRSTGGLGIEPRFPFCDRRLLEFCLALPGDQKLHQGYARIVMRRAMADILPQQVQWRVGKANFSFSLHQALLTYERDRFEEVIVKNPHLVEAYVDMQGIRQAYDRFLANSATEHDVNSLWRTACLGLWLQKTSLTP
jgi:asparagine synthase (glutamine-hydrolysing)